MSNDDSWQANRYPDLAALGGAQHWVFSRSQLRELGVRATRVDREIRTDRWRPLSPLVLMAGNGAPSVDQRLWCGHLHAGPRSALTHLTACHDAGLRWFSRDARVHVITQRGDIVEPLDGYMFHQTRRQFWRWVEHVPARPPRIEIHRAVLLTAERDVSIRRAIGLLAASVQQGLTEVDRLAVGIKEIRKLRHGEEFGWALGDIAGGAQSFAEIDIVRLCREAGLQPPDRQTRRRDKDGRWRYLDLEWVLPDGRRIVLEVDGSFHMLVENWSSDARRERHVVISGATVLRCTSVEIRFSPSDVLDDLRAVGVPPDPDSSRPDTGLRAS
jgi:hypothetical protein